jgi:hypothetical protein
MCVIAWLAPDVTNNHVPLSSGQNQSIKRNQHWVFFVDSSAFLMKATQSFKHCEPNLTHRHIVTSHKTWILSKTTERISNLALTQPTIKTVLWAFGSKENSTIITLTTQVSLVLEYRVWCFALVPNFPVTVLYINTWHLHCFVRFRSSSGVPKSKAPCPHAVHQSRQHEWSQQQEYRPSCRGYIRHCNWDTWLNICIISCIWNKKTKTEIPLMTLWNN